MVVNNCMLNTTGTILVKYSGGGVACYVDSTWPCTRLHEVESPNLETLWLLLRRSTMPRCVSRIAVGVVYHPPGEDNLPMLNHIIDCLDYIRRTHPSAGILVLGDFNSFPDKPVRDYPTKQVVTGASRGDLVLHKIFTNVAEWYCDPAVIPAIASSDHRAIVMSAKTRKAVGDSRRIITTMRSNSSNGRNLLAHALVNYDWHILHSFDNTDLKVAYFNETVKTLLDAFLPVYTVVRCKNDKPWVTATFRRLICARQFAWCSGDRFSYNRLLNKVNRLAKKLRANYYNKLIRSLHTQNPKSWWRGVNKLTGRVTRSDHRSDLQPRAARRFRKWGGQNYFASEASEKIF
jgi:hypothetical protein